MNSKTIESLIAFLAAMAHNSIEHAAKLRVLEQIAREHPEIFSQYENYFAEIRSELVFQKSHERTLEALEGLRTELLQD